MAAAWHHPLPPLALMAALLLAAGIVGVGRSAAHTRTTGDRWWARANLLETDAGDLVIPRILHQIYIGPPGDASTGPADHQPFLRGCRYQYGPAAGWVHMGWNASGAEALIASHVPWLLATYRNLTKLNERADLVRYAALHKFGGLYIDSDVECWREGSDMLAGADVGTWEEEGCASAMLASRPGAAVWEAAMRLAVGRRADARAAGRDGTYASIQRTGPILLADALESLGVARNASRRLDGKGLNRRLFHESYEVEGTRYHVYPAGSWFTPCLFWQDACMARVLEARADGVADLSTLVGVHRYRGSWIAEHEQPSLSHLRQSAKHLICAPFLATAQ
eukprot:scaffold9.g3291.t1